LENDVFSHLANFFKRYYKDGDFVSLRRYKKDTYAIPYEGGEVKLHWANSDQYYIKSGEYFRDYTFKSNDKTIHLKLSDAETQSNNNKATSDKERRFVILESNPCEVIEDELYINFEYKAIGKENQDKLNEKAIAKALESIEDLEFITALNELAPTEKNKKRTIFEKHLKSYTSRNSFDYFIHKDLGGFLGRELDFYIKNEILFLDDIMDSAIKYEEVMGKIKIFKEVSQKVIAFLTQLEELQKKLWEKKKFIIETNYCITLDKIEEKHYSYIFENKEQLAEWKELFGVDVQSVDNLKEEKYLVLDTKFFDMKFKYKLLSEFDNLDEDIDGVLINSENFGALTLLQNRYKEQIKTVYIDPPYNTGSDGFLYNDTYQHSSWISFMYDRIEAVSRLLNKDGVLLGSIDDNEVDNFYLSLKTLKFNYIKILPTIMNLKGNNDEYAFSGAHEYTIASSLNKTQNSFSQLNLDDEELEQWETDEIGLYKKGAPLRATGEEGHRENRPLMFYPLLINEKTNIVKTITPEEFSKLYSKDTKEFDDEYLNDLEIKYDSEGFAFILPKVDEVEFGRWRWGYNDKTIQKLNTEVLFSKTKNGYSLNKKQRPEIGDIPTKKPKSFFYKPEYSSGNGTAEQKSIFGKKIFANPKPLALLFDLIKLSTDKNSTILDYFSGSGTTGHSIINLNREDKGNRKYILVEMGEYFNSVTKPRIQKVIYSDSWKDGKITNKNGISQIFKYFKLESYEDSLNNLEFKKTEEQQKTLDFHPEAQEDYILNYSLDVESKGSLLNIDTFSTPFDYKLKIATSSVGETKDTTIDLVETFNYLLGLVVKRIELLKGYLVVEGQNLKKEKILII
ncbi:MAG: site-specific DNA-methyltransferase, partial [Candidatus Pacebacteria bacterium]|nr:site-specific DNA-methyltransferase [Candidatus Paceibacterota bacterium]